MNPIHQDDYNAIGTQHEQVTGRINDMLIELQNHSYATGVERGKALAKQAAIEAGTISPTLCQTIHLGQPGVTVEPCLMLGPADDEVACLLFTAPGTEVRLTWPTQTQALAVLAAATGEQEAAKECSCWKIGDHWLPEKHSQGCPIHNPGTTPQPVSAAQDVAGLVEALRRLERASDRRAALMSGEAYRMCSLIPGMDDALLELDSARKQARELLAAHQSGGAES